MNADRIVLVTTSLFHGGTEVVLKQLALWLRASGHAVSVVSMMEPTAFVQELQDAGVSVVSLGMKPGRPNLGAFAQFVRYVRRFRPSVLHAHMYHASILARLTGSLTGVPVVCTIHNEIECSHRKKSARLREWIYRISDRACACTTAVSARVRDRYLSERIVPRSDMPVIENGVDSDLYQPCPEKREQTRSALGWRDKFVWLAVGRLEIQKDYPGLIRSFQQIHRQRPESLLVIAGEGRGRSQLEALIKALGLGTAVTLMGARADIPDLLNACDAFVTSSEWEGCQLALLEAAATGRPAVATDVGAASEILLPGRTGFLIPPRDSGALTQAMEKLMAVPPNERDEMGMQARARVVARYSLHTAYRRYAVLYEEVLAAR